MNVMMYSDVCIFALYWLDYKADYNCNLSWHNNVLWIEPAFWAAGWAKAERRRRQRSYRKASIEKCKYCHLLLTVWVRFQGLDLKIQNLSRFVCLLINLGLFWQILICSKSNWLRSLQNFSFSLVYFCAFWTTPVSLWWLFGAFLVPFWCPFCVFFVSFWCLLVLFDAFWSIFSHTGQKLFSSYVAHLKAL